MSRSTKRNNQNYKNKKKFYSTKKFKGLLNLVFLSIILAGVLLNSHDQVSGNQAKSVRILVYNGTGADDNCVDQVINCLDISNTEKLTPNIDFIYNTTDTINTRTLTGYDVLIMPGGTDATAYLDNTNIDENAIKNFVSSGNGYIGICAGAYSGAEYIDDSYYGWAIAPHVITEEIQSEENLTVQFTKTGQQLLNSSEIMTMSHENGPAMYSTDANTVTFATYADNSTGYQGYAAIIGDYYGNGRTVLSGVHPELTPQQPIILANLILWADNIKSNSTNTTINNTT